MRFLNWALYEGKKVNAIINTLIMIILSLLVLVVILMSTYYAEKQKDEKPTSDISSYPYLCPEPPGIETIYYFSETFCSKVVDFGDSITVFIFRPDRPPLEVKYYEYENTVIDWMNLYDKNIRANIERVYLVEQEHQ